MTVLSHRQQHVLRRIMEALFASDAGQPPDERLAFALGEVADYATKIGLQTRIALWVAILVTQLSPFLLRARLARFTKLALPARVELLHALETSRLGLVVVLLKTVLCMHYFEHPAALAETGYDAQGRKGPAFAPGASPLLPLAPREER